MKYILLLIIMSSYNAQHSITKIDEYPLQDQCKTHGEFLIDNIKETTKQHKREMYYVCFPSETRGVK